MEHDPKNIANIYNVIGDALNALDSLGEGIITGPYPGWLRGESGHVMFNKTTHQWEVMNGEASGMG